MSKLIDDVRGFGRFFNELRQEKPMTFYLLAASIVLGIGIGLGLIFLAGMAPYILLFTTFHGIYIGGVIALLTSSITDFDGTAKTSRKLIMTQPMLIFGLSLSLIIVIAAVMALTFFPATLGPFLVTGFATLGFGMVPLNFLPATFMSGVALTCMVTTFALKGLVDIVQDLASCCCSKAEDTSGSRTVAFNGGYESVTSSTYNNDLAPDDDYFTGYDAPFSTAKQKQKEPLLRDESSVASSVPGFGSTGSN